MKIAAHVGTLKLNHVHYKSGNEILYRMNYRVML